MKRHWTRNVQKSVPRLRAPRRRVVEEKVKAPTKKEQMDVRDLSQPKALPCGRLEAPRPRKMVFPARVSCYLEKPNGGVSKNVPVCIEMKQLQALYALPSHSPVMRQHVMKTNSACIGSTTSFHSLAILPEDGARASGPLASTSVPAMSNWVFFLLQLKGIQ